MTTTTTTTMMMSTKKDTNDTPVVVVEDDVVIDGDSTNMTCGSIYFSLPVLTKSQWIQLLLLSLCFTLAFSSVTLVMSEAPLIVVNTGGQSQIAPISIAMFEIGKSFVVLPMQKIISKFGRKVIFLVGTILGLISSLVGLLGVLYLQPSLIIVSTLTCGFATGIAYGYRYAAIDVAANEREFAVTLCLSGGIIAAVVGPIGAIKSIHWFDIPYLGSYVSK
jgi:MFS family permease